MYEYHKSLNKSPSSQIHAFVDFFSDRTNFWVDKNGPRGANTSQLLDFYSFVYVFYGEHANS